jgi:hypothetical protein
VRSSEKDFEILQLGAFASPGLPLGPIGLTAESALDEDHGARLENAYGPYGALPSGGRCLESAKDAGLAHEVLFPDSTEFAMMGAKHAEQADR